MLSSLRILQFILVLILEVHWDQLHMELVNCYHLRFHLHIQYSISRERKEQKYQDIRTSHFEWLEDRGHHWNLQLDNLCTTQRRMSLACIL